MSRTLVLFGSSVVGFLGQNVDTSKAQLKACATLLVVLDGEDPALPQLLATVSRTARGMNSIAWPFSGGQGDGVNSRGRTEGDRDGKGAVDIGVH
jgi:hypothetical protein